MKNIIKFSMYLEANMFPLLLVVLLAYIGVEALGLADLETQNSEALKFPKWLAIIVTIMRFLFIAILEFLFTTDLSNRVYNLLTGEYKHSELLALIVSFTFASATSFSIWIISSSYQSFLMLSYSMVNGFTLQVIGGEITGKFLSMSVLILLSLLLGGFFLPIYRIRWEDDNGRLSPVKKEKNEKKEEDKKEDKKEDKEQKNNSSKSSFTPKTNKPSNSNYPPANDPLQINTVEENDGDNTMDELLGGNP